MKRWHSRCSPFREAWWEVSLWTILCGLKRDQFLVLCSSCVIALSFTRLRTCTRRRRGHKTVEGVSNGTGMEIFMRAMGQGFSCSLFASAGNNRVQARQHNASLCVMVAFTGITNFMHGEPTYCLISGPSNHRGVMSSGSSRTRVRRLQHSSSRSRSTQPQGMYRRYMDVIFCYRVYHRHRQRTYKMKARLVAEGVIEGSST